LNLKNIAKDVLAGRIPAPIGPDQLLEALKREYTLNIQSAMKHMPKIRF
jgi:hypothetical protein